MSSKSGIPSDYRKLARRTLSLSSTLRFSISIPQHISLLTFFPVVKLVFSWLLSYPMAGFLKCIPDSRPNQKNVFSIWYACFRMVMMRAERYVVILLADEFTFDVVSLSSISSGSLTYGKGFRLFLSVPQAFIALRNTFDTAP